MNAKFILLTTLTLAALHAVAQGVPCIDIRCPSNIVAQCQSAAGAPVAFTVTATNVCGTTVSLICIPLSGSTFPIGTITVNCTATGSGQTNRCSFPVTVIGNCSSNCLTIKCPSNLVVQCAANVPTRAANIGQFH